jgi:hypothetical protein
LQHPDDTGGTASHRASNPGVAARAGALHDQEPGYNSLECPSEAGEPDASEDAKGRTETTRVVQTGGEDGGGGPGVGGHWRDSEMSGSLATTGGNLGSTMYSARHRHEPPQPRSLRHHESALAQVRVSGKGGNVSSLGTGCVRGKGVRDSKSVHARVWEVLLHYLFLT